MKNTNFKTKLIARIMLLVLLLASAVSFVGCTIYAYNPNYYDHKYSKYNSFHSSYVFSAVTSDTNTFISDDVSFDFRYGFYEIGSEEPCYIYAGAERYGEIYFAIYLAKGEGINTFTFMNDCPGNEVEEKIKNIENHLYLKTITRSEALGEEYGYHKASILPLSKVIFNHVEKINIPKYFLNNNSNRFAIKIICFYPYENGLYSNELMTNIIVDYEVHGNIVKIDFEEGVYFE